jgi:hypothetical protein
LFCAGKVRENLDFIRNRFPRRSEVIPVLGVAVFVCHSWTMLGFLNKLSSFILYFTVAEIFGIFSYMMAVALLESLAVTGLIVLLGAILPSNWLRNGFAYKGFVIVAIASVAAILFQKFLPDDYPSTLMLAVSFIVPLALIAISIVVIHSIPKLQNFLLDIQDRISIMLYIYVPLGLLSIMVVIVRNLL